MVARDEVIFDLVSKINESIEKTSTECRKVFNYFNSYSFLWESDIHETFEQFLRGKAYLSHENKPRPPSKNFMNNSMNNNNTRNVARLISLFSFEIISNQKA